MASWLDVGHVPCDGNMTDFVCALEIWIEKPHVVNRRLCGVKEISETSVVLNRDTRETFLQGVSNEAWPKDVDCKNLGECIWNWYKKMRSSNLVEEREMNVKCRKLLSRNTKFENAFEMVILDSTVPMAIFIPVHLQETSNVTPDIAYSVHFDSSSNRIILQVFDTNKDRNVLELPSVGWLQKFVLPRLKKWCKNEPAKATVPSLSLVPVDRYNELYCSLKAKYGRELVEKWTEKTDPLKYVYEDVAIATYLLLLWEEERAEKNDERKQTAVDLGCGNGLLAYILSSEGHPCVGIDVRKRKIWDSFADKAVLKEEPIVPSPDTLYKDYDWLIGNHSDELTPWIPLFASRSSFDTRFFVLPCCSFDFFGKFQRGDATSSQYQSYLEYVRKVGENCGFHIHQDKLRIPSTKRICFIGKKRSYKKEDEDAVDKKRLAFIEEKYQETVAAKRRKTESSNNCTNDLVEDCANEKCMQAPIREAKEKVRNCTTLGKAFTEKIVSMVARTLLEASSESVITMDESGFESPWQTGGQVKLSELVAVIGTEMLSKLKNECGGLQTLLKNHGHIFRVVGGSVTLRNYAAPQPYKNSDRKRNIKHKTKPCWFFHHHPDGCPLSTAVCTFLHDEGNISEMQAGLTQ